MNLRDFEEHVNGIILQRGLGYFNQGRVSEVSRIDKYEYIFEVEGTEDYEVIVLLDEQEQIVKSECDCPFDGPVCKHEVASYYTLKEMYESGELPEIENRPETMTIDRVIESLDKKEMEVILKLLASQDKQTRKDIRFYAENLFDHDDLDELIEEIEHMSENIDDIFIEQLWIKFKLAVLRLYKAADVEWSLDLALELYSKICGVVDKIGETEKSILIRKQILEFIHLLTEEYSFIDEEYQLAFLKSLIEAGNKLSDSSCERRLDLLMGMHYFAANDKLMSYLVDIIEDMESKASGRKCLENINTYKMYLGMILDTNIKPLS